MPELVKLFGVKGKVIISFTVNTTGKLTDIKPLSNVGLGIDDQLAAAVAKSPRWLPGRQNGIPVGEKFTIPFVLNLSKDTIAIADLKGSSYSFIFQKKDKIYSIDQAESLIGKFLLHNAIEALEPYTSTPPFNVEHQDHLYLVKLKP